MKTTRAVYKPQPRKVDMSLENMLKLIPTATFIRMVMKSGLIPADQKAMVEAHKNL